MTISKFALGACTAAISAGCHTYVPATLDTVPQGAKVKALLSTEAQVDLQRRVGIDARELEGEVIELSQSELLLSVKVPPPPTGFSNQPLHQRIDVARQDVLRVDVQKVDAARTGLLAGGIAAAAGAAVVMAVLQEGSPGSPGGGGGGPNESRHRWVISLPVVRF